jgi:hypothetical protein
MTVIVNEMEVVVAAGDRGEASAAAPPQQAADPPPLTPREITEVLERRARIALRVMAH